MDVASVHLMTPTDADAHAIIDEVTVLLRDQFGIAHATLQVEPDTHQNCVEISW
jgi:cobalt-zinc-cadmium efflux system protein